MKNVKTKICKNGRPDETAEVLQLRALRTDYYTILADAMIEGGSSEDIVMHTAVRCRRADLPEEPCVERTASLDCLDITEAEVRKIFHAAYAHAVGRPQSAMNQKERIARSIADFFSRRYELRYNMMKGIEEFRPHDGVMHEWRQVTDRDLNRMTFEQMEEGGHGWGIDVQLYLHSTKVQTYDPVVDFLRGCGSYRSTVDHIGLLARRVPTDYRDWEPLFHRWFLAMVAQWMGVDKRFSNMLVPMLIGGQGTHKTTFCRMLLPPVLREYFIDDIKMDNAEQVERVLTRMALVNIDEYNAKTEREQAKIKRILAEKDVQVRRMRSDQYTLLQRRASFIATTNAPRPLTDPTGSRRYLCCPVKGIIDTDKPPHYRLLYAQAVHEIRQGEPYYLTREEERRMEAFNSQFMRQHKAELVLTELFEPVERHKDNLMTRTQVDQYLRQRLGAADMPKFREVTEALAAHFQQGAVDGRRGWYMRPV